MDADLDTENSDRLNKDLIEAAKNGDIKAVSKCLQKGALINYVDQSDNLTALHCASANGHKTIVSVLLDNGADLNDSTPDGWSILHTAALYGHKEIVSELLDRGSNPNAITRTFGVSVLYCAVQNGQKEIVAELLHNGCDPSRLMDYGNTPLHLSAENGHTELVSMLLDKTADINVKNVHGITALHNSARYGHTEVFNLLLEKSADPNAKTTNGNTPLHLSAENGHTEVVSILLDKTADINVKHVHGNTPSHMSAANGQKEVVSILLDNAADLNATNVDGSTALHLSSNNGHKEVVTILLDHAADPNIKNTDGNTPSHMSAANGQKEVVSILLDNAADLNATNVDGSTALHLSSNNGHKEVVTILLDHAADPNIKNTDGNTPLHMSAANGQKEVVSILLDNAADLNATNIHGSTALHLSSNNGHKEVVTILLDHAADPNIKNTDGLTALHLASYNGLTEVVTVLLDHAAEPNVKTADGWTALDLSSKKGHIEVVTVLLDKDADPNAKDADGRTALHLASYNGLTEVVTILLDHAADPNVKTAAGWTALDLSSKKGHIEVVTVLLDKDADPNAKDADGRTALHLASYNGLTEVVTIILDHAADPNVKTADGWTALHLASYNGLTEVVTVLLDHAADPNVKTEDGWTSLHLSSKKGHIEVVTVLIDKTVDPNEKHADGWTALHLASNKGHKEVVTVLLEKAADPNAKDADGETALHWASLKGHIEVVTILLDHDAEPNAKSTEGWLPLHCAASAGDRDIVSEIFRRGTDANAETSKGETALHLSSRNGHKEVVTILLDHAAHPNAKTADGWLPLHCAASAGDRDIVSELLRRGTDANAETSKGITALHLASSNGHMEVVTILLDYSADPNIKSADVSRKGWLALHFAEYNGHSDIVSELIRRGTDVDSVTTKEEKEKCKDMVTSLYESNFKQFRNYYDTTPVKVFSSSSKVDHELLHQLRGFGLGTASDLQELLRESSFQSFWNRVYLVGPNSVGKSCLAKILVGEQVPQSRKSTDGIWIYMGRAGMDVDEMKWIYFEKGNAVTEILTNMLMTVSSAEAATEARDNSTNFHKKQKLLEPAQKCEYLEMKDGNEVSLVGAKAIKYNASSHHETKRGMADSSTIVHPKQATARKFRNQEMQIDDVRQSGLLEDFSTPYALSHQDSKRKTADTIVDLKSYEGNSFDIQRSEGYINPNSSQEGIQGEHGKYNEHKVADDQCSISDKIKTSSVFDSSVKQLIRELSIGKTQTNQMILEQLDSEWMKEISSDMSIDKLHELMVKAVKEGKYKQMVVPIDIWDFGGQKEYHMTHQLFITSRGIFILMFDGSIGIHKHRSDLGFLPGHFGKPTAAVYLLHWVNSILTFCKRSKEGFPKILFVATHKDMLPWKLKYRFESYRQKLENKIQKIFESHAGLKHLEFKPLLFINSTNPEDPEIKELQQRVMKRATEHPRWGEEMPTAWIPLDLQLTMKVEEGTNILSLEQIKSLNSKKKSMALSEKQIVTFLEVQHSLGKLLYFNVENLRDYVIISPAYLVEVLRSIVTEKQFWCKSGRFPSILKNIQETGFIDKEDIYHLWTQKEFMHFLKYKEYMVDLLVHLDVIIAPRTSFELSSSPLRDVSRFLVPCMITKTNDTKYLEKFWNYNNSIVMAYRFIEEIIPPALSYRFLGSLVAMWHVKKYACTKNKREKTLLFSDLYVVEVGNSHELAVQVKGNRVVVSLVHTVNKGNIIPTLASSIQECLTTAMLGICQFYSTLSDAQNSSSKHQAMPFEIEFGVFCKSDICFFHHNDIRPNSPWFCSQHRKKNEVGYLQAWFSEKEPSDKCLSTCIGLGRMALERSPSDKHLRRLVGEFSPGKCRELAIELGLSVHEWENFEYQFQFQIPDDLKFVAIRSCREKSRNFTFRMLVGVLEKLELSQHLLCKVLRDVKPDVSGIPEDTLNNPPSDKLLFDLSNHIGNSSMQLAIELDLDSTAIQQIQYKHKTKLLEQTKEILQIWSKKKQPTPTLLLLIKALHRIGKMGSLRGVRF